MNITFKKQLFIITALLAGVAFMASCSKEPEARDTSKKEARKAETKETKKGKKASAAARASAATTEEVNNLKAFRNGQYVTLDWHIDATGGKIARIDIVRSPTGVGKQRKVAELPPDAGSYRDCLPDANAQWYWIKLFTADNKFQEIGPVRVEPDKAGSANYINREAKYNVSVTRTDDLATLKWDFPEEEYRMIDVLRFPRPVTEAFKGTGSGVPVVSTLERQSQCDNALPDPNSDYWYWFRIRLKSGAIIYKGPIKADYAKTGKK